MFFCNLSIFNLNAMDTNLKILIVDDDRDDIDLFCLAMEKIDPGAECRAAKDCEEALKTLRLEYEDKDLPDCIFLDLNMPCMDGKTCLKELKKDAKLKEIPVIIYTTSSHERDKEETAKLGAAYFLTKAYSFSQMREGIANALEIVSSSNTSTST